MIPGDEDRDGHVGEEDCDEGDPSICMYDCAELCRDFIDNDCDGETDEGCVDP